SARSGWAGRAAAASPPAPAGWRADRRPPGWRSWTAAAQLADEAGGAGDEARRLPHHAADPELAQQAQIPALSLAGDDDQRAAFHGWHAQHRETQLEAVDARHL